MRHILIILTTLLSVAFTACRSRQITNASASGTHTDTTKTFRHHTTGSMAMVDSTGFTGLIIMDSVTISTGDDTLRGQHTHLTAKRILLTRNISTGKTTLINTADSVLAGTNSRSETFSDTRVTKKYVRKIPWHAVCAAAAALLLSITLYRRRRR